MEINTKERQGERELWGNKYQGKCKKETAFFETGCHGHKATANNAFGAEGAIN